jgi:hypothetical protein
MVKQNINHTWKGKRLSIKIMTVKKKTLMETIMHGIKNYE